MKKIELIKNTDKEFPQNLLNIEKSPKELYIIGNKKLLNKIVIMKNALIWTLLWEQEIAHLMEQNAQKDLQKIFQKIIYA